MVNMKTAFAIAAHPDDIELMMAGTLLQLKKAGYEIHYMNISGGNCGTTEFDEATIKAMRLEEAKEAADILGAHFHLPFRNDMEIFYDDDTLRRMAAIIREVKPSIVLTHSPADYMEDHTNTCRLAVSAAFARGMSNYRTTPQRAAANYDCTIYHALPHTLHDNLYGKITPHGYVNTGAVHATKLQALKAHRSQQNWLDTSQHLNSYLQTMEAVSRQVGLMSGRFAHAEGWRRHLHVGFCAADADPLQDLGADYLVIDTPESDNR